MSFHKSKFDRFDEK